MENYNYYQHGNLMKIEGVFIAIRNEALRSKYPGSTDRLALKYHTEFNHLISVKSAESRAFLIDIIEDITDHGLVAVEDYYVGMINPEVGRYGANSPTSWLRAYGLDNGIFLSFTGYGQLYFLIEAAEGILVQADILFSTTEEWPIYYSCPPILGIIPSLVFLNCPEPYNLKMASHTARYLIKEYAMTWAYKNKSNVYLCKDSHVVYRCDKYRKIEVDPPVPEGGVMGIGEFEMASKQIEKS